MPIYHCHCLAGGTRESGSGARLLTSANLRIGAEVVSLAVWRPAETGSGAGAGDSVEAILTRRRHRGGIRVDGRRMVRSTGVARQRLIGSNRREQG